ncbi:MAG: hypothetical protein KME25_15985 [Symplocastrum torsivum CPER-KK1]|uniref:Uncharacterized protein n=1 Tax=Symplocastrum torsivum CPER-KK1 TaxID=450513 RepID=A0A951PMW3_9CYAN|nr:hypothetical protein [Symplocastrum torsivum CPER-KK1]
MSYLTSTKYVIFDKSAKGVAQHFQENVEPLGFKAFLVAVDRVACVQDT